MTSSDFAQTATILPRDVEFFIRDIHNFGSALPFHAQTIQFGK